MATDKQPTIDADIKEGELNEMTPAISKTSTLWIALIVVLVISIVLSVWLSQTQRQLHQQAQDELRQLHTEKQQLQAMLQQTQTQLTALQKDQKSLSDGLNDLKAQQQFSTAELLAQWQLREVEFLLNIANQRAVLVHDVPGAMQALKMADEKLQQLADYRLHPLRAHIAEELMNLQALADVDVSGMAIQLQTAINHVDSLRVVKGPQVTSGEPQPQLEQQSTSQWQQAVSDIWQQVRSLVVIRHTQSGDAAVLIPEQRYFLYQNLKLQLESARLSLLNADSTGYQHSLTVAIGWLNQYFIGVERDAMLANLTALQDKPVSISIPDISTSLAWLREYQQ